MALKNQVRAAAADVEIIPQESPPGDHKAAGAAENAVKRVKGLARTVALTRQTWVVGDDGKTAEQLRTGRGWHRPAIAYGETVLVKKLQATVAKKDLESRFVRGRFLGHVSRSATALVMTAQGITRGTGLSRLAESERWDAANVAELKGVPWDEQGTELAERVPPQALPAPLTLPVPPQRPTAG
eukprot:4013705-Amphidinium_carterae.1